MMKGNIAYELLVLCLILLVCHGCKKAEKGSKSLRQKGNDGYVLAQGITPQSTRSQEAIARKTLTLQRKFTEASLTLGAPIFLRIFKESQELEVWV